MHVWRIELDSVTGHEAVLAQTEVQETPFKYKSLLLGSIGRSYSGSLGSSSEDIQDPAGPTLGHLLSCFYSEGVMELQRSIPTPAIL